MKSADHNKVPDNVTSDTEGNVFIKEGEKYKLLESFWCEDNHRWAVKTGLTENPILYVHHIVSTQHVNNPLEMKYIVFKDGDVSNCSADNLSWSDKPHREQLPLGTRWVMEFEGLYYTNGVVVFDREGVSQRVGNRNGWLYVVLKREGREFEVSLKRVTS